MLLSIVSIDFWENICIVVLRQKELSTLTSLIFNTQNPARF